MAELILQSLIVVGTAVLGIRLWAFGLSHRYRAFFYYVVFYTLQTGFMMSLKRSSGLYQQVYILTEPIAWVFYALVVLELYALVLERYQGLYTVGRWALIVAVVLALLASAVSLLAPSHDPVHASRLLPYYYIAERAVYLSLVVFLLTILYFLMQYPVDLNRNIVVHSIVYSVYFLSNTISFLLLSARGYGATIIIGYAVTATTLGAVIAWLALLTPAGEKRKVSLRPDWMPGREEQLVEQLNSLNAILLRATRK